MNAFWKQARQNGTKWIGAAGSVVATVALIDPTLLTALFGLRGLAIIMLASSIATGIRGFTNTAAIKQDMRAEGVIIENVEAVK